MSGYFSPAAGLPPQIALITDRAIVTEAYTVIPHGVLRDIVVSYLPGWRDARAWVLARPIIGFSTTFAQYLVEIGPGGGSDDPEPQATVESLVFVLTGRLRMRVGGRGIALRPGSFAFIPAGSHWTVDNPGDVLATFQWIRKPYEPLAADGGPDDRPPFVTGHETDQPRSTMPGTDDFWAVNLIPTGDLRYDMHVNIVSFRPGAVIPFAETHIMEHGIYVLQGKGVYRLNQDWVEVEAGDFMWLRAFCPQACYAGGPDEFRYLLYKDVNRQVLL